MVTPALFDVIVSCVLELSCGVWGIRCYHYVT